MRSAKRIYELLVRALPWATRRDWGAVAIIAARQAGLCDEDIASLMTNLANQWACERVHARPRLKRGDLLRRRSATTEHGIDHHDRPARRSKAQPRAGRISEEC